MGRIVHFEVNADDPARAIKFYSTAFGWKIEQWAGEPYWLATTGPDDQLGINGAIMPRGAPGVATVNWVGVDNIDEAMAKVKAAGGKVTGQKQEVPGIGWTVYCEDTEGNPFGIIQPTMAPPA